MRKIVAVSFPTAIAATAVPCAAQDAATGKRAFAVCSTCHNGDPDGPGPALAGVVGRRAGSVPDFRYSTAMKQSGIVWTAATLKAFLLRPQTVVRGNRMPFGGVANPADAEAIVAYLATLK